MEKKQAESFFGDVLERIGEAKASKFTSSSEKQVKDIFDGEMILNVLTNLIFQRSYL